MHTPPRQPATPGGRGPTGAGAVAPFAGLPGVSAERGVPCRVADGTVLRADVYRPAGGGRHPVLLLRLPYGKDAADSHLAYPHPAQLAAGGYVVVVQDCRGTGASGGEFYPFAHEARDGVDTIEWAARLAGSDGRVAMYGFSYAGMAQLLAAASRPAPLVAVAPAFTGSQAYEGWIYNQGAFALAFASSWATSLRAASALRAGDDAAHDDLAAALRDAAEGYWSLPLRDYPFLGRGGCDYFEDWLAHPAYDDYWRRWSIDEDYSRLAVPALHVTGWYDVFLAGTVRNFTGLRRHAASTAARAGQKLVIGPWAHQPWVPVDGHHDAGAGPRTLDDWHSRWFDRMLRGREDVDVGAPVTAYLLHDGWHEFEDWPPPASMPTDWYLRSGGRANTRFGDGRLDLAPGEREEPPDLFVHDPLAPVPSRGGHSCCRSPLVPMGPACQCDTESLPGVLVYTTAPLERDLVLAGQAELTLFAASTAPDTDFTARLCLVDPTGCSTNVQEGIVRARYRRSTSEPRLLEPGAIEEYRIDLGPVGARVPAGYRIRLDVSSSDFPQWSRNLGTGGDHDAERASEAVTATQVVLHDRDRPSRLSLPVVG